MPTIAVDAESPADDAIRRAAEIIRGGGLVAFPTETVYGLGANALEDEAVERIYAAKGRPSHNPLIVHVSTAARARELVEEWPKAAERLVERFWPGPLTLVLRRGTRVPSRVSAGLDTVAIRVPAHPVALALLEAAGIPIVAPSANPSTSISPTRAEHVEKGLGDRVDLILDGGPTGVGIESTVVDLTGPRPALLRPGAVTVQELEAIVGDLAAGPHAEGDEARSSPGMLARHYAPRAAVRLFDGIRAPEALAGARRESEAGRRVGALLVGSVTWPESDSGTLPFYRVRRLPADATGYGRGLYAALHELDDAGCDLILIEALPAEPEWTAVRDRITRAAEPPR